MINTKARSIVVSFLFILSFNPIFSSTSYAVSQKEFDKILEHCTVMREFGINYASSRASGLEGEAAWKQSSQVIATRYAIGNTQKLETITGVYASFIELLETFQPNTTGYFVLSHCLVTHAQKMMLPVHTEQGVAAINEVLAGCEQTAQDEDSLGACVLNGLRPLAVSQ